MPPLYYPRRRSQLMDVAGLGLKLYGMQKGIELAKGEQDIATQKLGLQQRRADVELGTPGKPGTLERGVGVAEASQKTREATLRLAEQNAEADRGAIARSRTPLSAGQFALVKSGLKQLDNVLGYKVSVPGTTYLNQMKSLSDKGMVKRELYDYSRANWDVVKQPFVEEAQKALDNTKGDENLQKKLTAEIDAMDSPDYLDRFYPNSARARQIEEEAARLETLKATKTPGTQKAYITPQGTIDYLPSNQRPPAGYVPYSTGIDVDVDKEGAVSLRTGVGRAGPGGVQRRTAGALEEKIISTSEGIARLDEISQSFKPEFLELGTKWGAFATKWKEKLKGTPAEKLADLGTSEQETQDLEEFTAFRRDAIDNINRYIKEITGAQMSEREADRLRKAAPDPGEGFFDGDSPTEFQSKWKSSMRALKLSQARALYLRSSGLSEEAIAQMAKQDTLTSLSQIKGIIEQRDKELELDARKANPNASDAEIDSIVSQQLNQEFGL